jgi:hypothetical protein
MEQIDDLLDLGLDEFQAEEVLLWHKEQLRKERQEWGGVIIARLISYLLTKRHKDNNLRIRVLGLAFGWGLGKLTGHPSAEAAARAEGCTGMAISRKVKEAREALGFHSSVSM